VSETSCANCKLAGTHKRPKIMGETGFDDQLMFDDVDETVYMCKATEGEHAGREIGIEPITCALWTKTSPQSDRLAELDRRIAEREARVLNKEQK